MTENDKDYFEPIDVSEPRAPRKEIEIIEEALAIRRRDWIQKHMTYIYAVIGVIIVGLVAFFIYTQFRNTNPMSRFSNSLSKDFGTSFHFDVRMTEDGADMMRYDGNIKVDRDKHTLRALYEADYNDYGFTGAVYADDQIAMKGSLYQNKWMLHDCTDMVLDFFDFDADFRSGSFDGGAFLRFTGLTSDYSTRELNRFVGILKSRLSTDSPIADISTEKVDEGTRYNYVINIHELFKMVDENGASVFYRSTDYDKYTAAFGVNEGVLQNAECTASFVISSEGYMTSFDMSVYTEGTTYGLSCKMSDFGSAKVEVPSDFLKAAYNAADS